MTRRILALSLMAAAIPLAAADIPRQAIDIPIRLDNGQQTKLSAYKGKVVAVLFILTGCSHCQAASKALEKVYQAYKGRGFEVVAIAIDPMAKGKLGDFRKEQQVTFPLAYDEAMVAFNFMQHPLMLRPTMPQLAFVDREGVIRAQYPGESP
ncbi:MAG: TlpA disulfide reductase family protein, partial [Acidobacteria bacterium]|nr:TlpA disulfide reductase family protein [Acidobacteriota bacterium]